MNYSIEEIITSLAPYTTGIFGHKKALLKHILPLIPPGCRVVGEPFGGTGIVTAAIKRMGKKVITNDILRFGHLRLVALVACNKPVLTDADLGLLATTNPDRDTYVTDNYPALFGAGNAEFLDSWGANVRLLDSPLKRQVAIFLAVMTVMQEIKSNRCTTNFSPTGALTGNRHLRDVDLRAETLNYAMNVYPGLLHDNGLVNEAWRMDALDFMDAVTCDAWILDSPYCCKVANYSAKLTLYEKLVMILGGEGSKIIRFRDTDAYLPPFRRFERRDESMMGFAEIFRRAGNVPLVLLCYNSTSEITPREIASVGASFGRKVLIHPHAHRRPTTMHSGKGEKSTIEVLLECTL